GPFPAAARFTTSARPGPRAGGYGWKRAVLPAIAPIGCWNGPEMALLSYPSPQYRIRHVQPRRFLALYLPFWATDYLKRADPALPPVPLALYERIKGGLRLAAIDPDLSREGLRIGQNLADARAIKPDMVVREIDRPLLESAFEGFADWHS